MLVEAKRYAGLRSIGLRATSASLAPKALEASRSSTGTRLRDWAAGCYDGEGAGGLGAKLSQSSSKRLLSSDVLSTSWRAAVCRCSPASARAMALDGAVRSARELRPRQPYRTAWRRWSP